MPAFPFYLRHLAGLALCLALAGAPAFAQLDLRILVLDTGHFAKINPLDSRKAAIKAMIKQLGEIEATEPAAKTVLLYEDESSIEKFAGLDDNSPVSGQAGFQKLMEDIERGKSYGNAGFELVDLHDKTFHMLGNMRVLQKKGWRAMMPRSLVRSKKFDLKTVSIHVFAQDWVTEEDGTNEEVAKYDTPASCVHDTGKSKRLIPSYIDVTFDFRPPLGGLAPTEAGMSSLITVVGGSAARRSNILTSGSRMPGCLGIASNIAEPWETNAGSGGPSTCTTQRAKRNPVVACENIPSFNGIAANLDAAPVHLVADSKETGLATIGLMASGTSAGFDILAHVGPLALKPGATPVTHGLAPSRYPALLELNPSAGCRPSAGFDLRLGELSGQEKTLSVSVSRHYCQTVSLPLSELDLK